MKKFEYKRGQIKYSEIDESLASLGDDGWGICYMQYHTSPFNCFDYLAYREVQG
jgi:hypothetical protein